MVVGLLWNGIIFNTTALSAHSNFISRLYNIVPRFSLNMVGVRGWGA